MKEFLNLETFLFGSFWLKSLSVEGKMSQNKKSQNSKIFWPNLFFFQENKLEKVSANSKKFVAPLGAT